jgi:hypothetical protein
MFFIKKMTLSVRNFNAFMVQYDVYNIQPLDYVLIQFNPGSTFTSTFPKIHYGTVFRAQILTLLLYIHNSTVFRHK